MKIKFQKSSIIFFDFIRVEFLLAFAAYYRTYGRLSPTLPIILTLIFLNTTLISASYIVVEL